METLQTYSLCDHCSIIDLSPLTAPLPVLKESHRKPAAVYEEQLSVYIPYLQLDHAKRNPQCRLCNLLSVCAHRTGEEHALDHKAVCVRPKLVWLADVGHATHESAKLYRTGQLHVWFHEIKTYSKGDRSPMRLLPRLLPSDQRWDPSARRKNASNRRENATDREQGPSDRESNLRESEENRQGPLIYTLPESRAKINLKSAVASWMLDIVHHSSELSDCERVPISRITDTTMIRNWLIKCDEGHSHLPGPGSSASRILHIISRRLLRVSNTSTGDIETISELTDFVALSYVWGREREPDQSLKALPIMDYAATIRDAATLAQSLGFDWLWVDRICIDQSNDNEKAVLIPYIKVIFASATLTVVAASGNGAHFGLPGSPHTAREEEMPLRLGPNVGVDGDVLQLLAEQPSFNTLLNDSVWHTRGWTFEEEVFSRRLLYIFPTEIFFSCNKGTYRESTVNKFVPEPAGSTWADFGATPPLITAELNATIQQRGSSSARLLTTRQFVRAVEEYTSRHSTIEEDRVGAFAGLITASIDVDDGISELSLLKHGHPLSFFETALTWQPTEDAPSRHTTFGEPFVPSWSWASAGSKVHFQDNGEEDNKSEWFQFGILGDLDILGVPSSNILPGNRSVPSQTILSKNLGLDFPSNLINSEPWSDNIRVSFLDNSDAMFSSDRGITRSRMLPTLHLVSVVFEAMFANASEGLHSLEPITGPGVGVTGHWAIASKFLSGRQKFAVVAGNANICIMALKQESTEGIFSRVGLMRVSWYGSTPLFSIMRQGNARWEYIRLI